MSTLQAVLTRRRHAPLRYVQPEAARAAVGGNTSGEVGGGEGSHVEGNDRTSLAVQRSRQAKARYWIFTIPHRCFTPYLPSGWLWLKGQLEEGAGGFLHWQFVGASKDACRLSSVKKVFGEECHAEPTKSKAAEDYCCKVDTRVAGTEFELGRKAIQRGNCTDWDAVLASAKDSRFADIPADVYVRYYGNIKRISVECSKPLGILRRTVVYWGPTGTGKSRRAWDEASLDAYPKDPCTKFWDGYNGQENVVIDEFRGIIGISHLLRWLDRYPVLVEVKGSSTVLKAQNIWITSNLEPRMWYPNEDRVTVDALMRRLEIVEMN
ncbi:MAG: helicase [Cressdnaviricota sp.]|nr:MAG: helicase [Cressdnaviricota sp.]